MLYFYKENIYDYLSFWSDSCGDLHHKGEYRIDNIEDLPTELQTAYSNLWSEDEYGLCCYLVEFKGEYGIMLSAEYDSYDAEDRNISYKELKDIIVRMAYEVNNNFSSYSVIYGEDAILWSDGTTQTILAVFIPYNTSKKELDNIGRYLKDYIGTYN